MARTTKIDCIEVTCNFEHYSGWRMNCGLMSCSDIRSRNELIKQARLASALLIETSGHEERHHGKYTKHYEIRCSGYRVSAREVLPTC
jgi:hypothetical protein